MRSETIITGDLGGELFVALEVLVHRESFTRQVVEVIERGEGPFGMVFLSEILYASRFAERFILAADVVGHKVDEYTESGVVGAFDKGFELLHTLGFVLCQVGIDIVIIGDGIRRTGFAFGDSRVVVLGCGVSDDSGVPNMRSAQIRNGLERTLVDIYKSPAAILFLGAVMFARLVVVAKQAREELVNNGFVHGR